jgi:GAF domain-containing protein
MQNTIADIDLRTLNEKNRLRALKRYKLVNGLPKDYFTKLAQSVAETFHTPIALVSIVDKEHVAFPGNVGIPNIEEIPRNISLCSIALLKDHPTVYTDTLKEPSLLSNPLIAGDFGLRFYAGAPIICDDGYALGVVCIVDKQPRELSEKDVENLQSFANEAMHQIKQRLKSLH